MTKSGPQMRNPKRQSLVPQPQRTRPEDQGQRTKSETFGDIPNRNLLERLGQAALHLGTRSFLVGGPVRDLILERKSPDLDIAVEEGSREFGAVVAKELGGRFVYHARFFSGSVILPPTPDPQSPTPVHIDITQTRAETYERPAVLPAVRPASIVGDLGRRDFTINAMALEITPGSFGEFIDPFDGRTDVEQRRVRVLHARSFIDDPTRVFRCIRFATRLGFEIERQTLDLMRSAIGQRLPAFLTPERVLYELRLICAEPLVVSMVRALIRERLLEAAWRWTPPSRFLAGMRKLAKSLPGRYPRGQSTTGQSPDFAGRADLLFIYWLSVLPVTDRFPIRKEERDAAEAIAEFGTLRTKLKPRLKPSAVYQVLRGVPEPALAVLAAL